MIIYIIKNIMSSKHAIDIHKNQEYRIQVMNFFRYLYYIYIYIYHRHHEYQAILASDKLTRGHQTLVANTFPRLHPRESGGRLIG